MSILRILAVLVVAILVAFLLCLIVGGLEGVPGWFCTAAYVVAVIAWLWWAFNERRV